MTYLSSARAALALWLYHLTAALYATAQRATDFVFRAESYLQGEKNQQADQAARLIEAAAERKHARFEAALNDLEEQALDVLTEIDNKRNFDLPAIITKAADKADALRGFSNLTKD